MRSGIIYTPTFNITSICWCSHTLWHDQKAWLLNLNVHWAADRCSYEAVLNFEQPFIVYTVPCFKSTQKAPLKLYVRNVSGSNLGRYHAPWVKSFMFLLNFKCMPVLFSKYTTIVIYEPFNCSLLPFRFCLWYNKSNHGIVTRGMINTEQPGLLFCMKPAIRYSSESTMLIIMY